MRCGKTTEDERQSAHTCDIRQLPKLTVYVQMLLIKYHRKAVMAWRTKCTEKEIAQPLTKVG